MMSQKLSCASGQLYFRRLCRKRIVSRTSAILPGGEVDEEEDEESMLGDWVGILRGTAGCRGRWSDKNEN